MRPQTRRDWIRQAAAAGATAPMLGGSITRAAGSGNESEWLRWRGSDGSNHAAPGSQAPPSISSGNIQWSVSLPGRGHCSPIAVGDSLFMTTADPAAQTQSVLSVSRSGKPRGMQTIHTGGLPAELHRNNTHASPTLACDGEHLFAAFYNSGAIRLTKLTPGGKIVWQRNAGAFAPQQFKYGYAASPLLYRDTVIVAGDFDGDAFLVAMDRTDGKTAWKIRRPGRMSFSSPIVANVNGRDQLLLSGCEMVAAYDPANGKQLWKTPGATTSATCGTMVWDDQRVFASGGYPEAETVCIAADGSGNVLWSNNVKCYEQSMLAHQGYIYAIADSGVAYCWRAADGETMWRERMGGRYSSSPILVGDAIHVISESGEGHSFAASPQGFERLGQSRVGDEMFASPIVVDNTMYLRVANRGSNRQEKLLAVS